jgi:hypothetical protein
MPIADALRLVDEIAATQGVQFIRELLREKKRAGANVLIGIRKDEVLEHLAEAIRAGHISLSDLIEWLNDVEGWGKQHVYLYRATAQLLTSRIWRAPVPHTLLAHARAKGLTIPNEERRVFGFPDSFTLGRLHYDGQTLEMVWRKGVKQWRRDAERDQERTIEGDQYKFIAWRHTPERSVLRFILRPKEGVAALFVQVPLGDEHEQARKAAFVTLERLFQTSRLNPIPMSECIKALDAAGQSENSSRLRDGRGTIRPQATAFSTYGGAVEFRGKDGTAYVAVESVRRVRRAVRLPDFSGASSRFLVDLETGPGLTRSVRMNMDGEGNHLYLFAQMTAEEVWAVINHVFAVAP